MSSIYYLRASEQIVVRQCSMGGGGDRLVFCSRKVVFCMFNRRMHRMINLNFIGFLQC